MMSCAYYNTDTAMTLIGSSLDIISGQLKDNEHYTTIRGNNALPTLTKFYGDIVVPVGISGEIVQSDYAYSVTSDVSAEIQQVTLNEAKVAKVYKRFRIDGNITDGSFTMNESVQKQGNSGITGVVYGFHEDDNYKYLDVAVTAGTWQVTDVIQGLEIQRLHKLVPLKIECISLMLKVTLLKILHSKDLQATKLQNLFLILLILQQFLIILEEN